jgi:hypothetical protein
VFDLDEGLMLVLTVAVFCGGWGVWRVRGGRDHDRTLWPRRVFLVSLAVLGGGSLVGVLCAARILVPFGLAAGWLVIAMLWENPFRVWQEG